MFKRNAIAVAIGSIALFSGCASTAPSVGLEIEPVMAVRGGVGADGQYRIGRYFQGQQRLDAAEKAFLKALALDPYHAEARNALGTVYFELGRIQKAEEQFRLAIAIAPTRAHLHNNLGYLYQEIGRTDEAVSAYSEAFRLDPKNPRIQNNLAALTCQDKRECMALDGDAIAAPVIDRPPVPASPREVPSVSSTALTSVVPMPTDAATPVAQRRANAEVSPASTASDKPMTPTVQLANVAPNIWELKPVVAAPQRVKTPVAPVATIPSAPEKAAFVQSMQAATGRVEVANGNGVRGMAKRIGGYMREQGFAAPRLTNHQTFSQNKTEIQYVAGSEDLARQIESTFGQSARLVKVASLERHAPVRVVLGKDFDEATVLARGGKSTGRIVLLGQ
jgi:tetratricopeptide (TPR) repeat protein